MVHIQIIHTDLSTLSQIQQKNHELRFFLRCRNDNVGISVIVAHLTVSSYRSRQFPTVLVPGHVHRNKLISLLNREEQQEPRKRRQRIFFFFFFIGWKRKVDLTARERNGGRERRKQERQAALPNTADGSLERRGERWGIRRGGKPQTTGSKEEGRLRGADRKKCQRKARSGRDTERRRDFMERRGKTGMGGLWKQTDRQKREGEKKLILICRQEQIHSIL